MTMMLHPKHEGQKESYSMSLYRDTPANRHVLCHDSGTNGGSQGTASVNAETSEDIKGRAVDAETSAGL